MVVEPFATGVPVALLVEESLTSTTTMPQAQRWYWPLNNTTMAIYALTTASCQG